VFIANSPGDKLASVGLFPKTEERLKITFVADIFANERWTPHNDVVVGFTR